MFDRRRVLGVIVLLGTLAAIVYADQPYMRAARTDLQQARAQLQAALANKGGHRVKAIEHVNNAIAYVNQGIAWDRRHNHAQRATSEVLGLAAAPDQPHMQAALDNLRQARSNLERATSDKGGYRVKAIDEVNKAIDETKKGIDAGE
jgi:multidrug resistance efflux pump